MKKIKIDSTKDNEPLIAFPIVRVILSVKLIESESAFDLKVDKSSEKEMLSLNKRAVVVTRINDSTKEKKSFSVLVAIVDTLSTNPTVSDSARERELVNVSEKEKGSDKTDPMEKVKSSLKLIESLTLTV